MKRKDSKKFSIFSRKKATKSKVAVKLLMKIRGASKDSEEIF